MKNIKHAIILALSIATLGAGGAAVADGKSHTQQQGNAQIISVSSQDLSSHYVTTNARPDRTYHRSNYYKTHSTYRVRPGDTLSRIAVKTGVSVHKLVRLNKLYGARKNHLEVGQKLRLS